MLALNTLVKDDALKKIIEEMKVHEKAHSDFFEFIGEFGLIGSTFISLCLIFLCANKNFLSFKNFLLCYLLIFILIFDFSFHIPIIQFLFILLLSVSYKRSDNFEYRFTFNWKKSYYMFWRCY